VKSYKYLGSKCEGYLEEHRSFSRPKYLVHIECTWKTFGIEMVKRVPYPSLAFQEREITTVRRSCLDTG
jgi:hypothetical protein